MSRMLLDWAELEAELHASPDHLIVFDIVISTTATGEGVDPVGEDTERSRWAELQTDASAAEDVSIVFQNRTTADEDVRSDVGSFDRGAENQIQGVVVPDLVSAWICPGTGGLETNPRADEVVQIHTATERVVSAVSVWGQEQSVSTDVEARSEELFCRAGGHHRRRSIHGTSDSAAGEGNECEE